MNDTALLPGEPPTWSVVPTPPPSHPAGILTTWLAATATLVIFLARSGQDLGIATSIAVVVFVALLVTRRTSARSVRIVTWVGVLVGTALLTTLVTGFTAVTLPLSWGLALGSIRHRRIRRRDLKPTIGALAISFVAAVAGSSPWMLVGCLLASASIAATLIAPRIVARGVAVGDRVGKVLGTWLAALAMLPVTIVVIALSALYRLVGHDPLHSRSVPGPRWVAHERWAEEHPHRATDPSARPVLPSARRRRRLAHAMAGLVIVAAVAAIALQPPATPQSKVFAHDPSWPEVWAEQSKFNSDPSFDNTTIWRLNDFTSRFVNQKGGRRRTWAPPPCTCVRRTVWWFGGSAAWGFYQRDDDTIPSQIAREAWQHGIALDVVNLALPGYSASQEVQLLAQMVVTEPPPDLVVFYDGANELYLQEARNNEGRGSDESPASYAERSVSTFFQIASAADRLRTARSGGTHAPRPGPTPMLDPSQVAHHAVNRYRRQIELARRTAAAANIPVVFTWQPVMSTSPPRAADEFDPMRPSDARWHRDLASAARAELPSDVVDLSDALDGVDRPVFPDWAHTNEVGARIVATDIVQLLVRRSLVQGDP